MQKSTFFELKHKSLKEIVEADVSWNFDNITIVFIERKFDQSWEFETPICGHFQFFTLLFFQWLLLSLFLRVFTELGSSFSAKTWCWTFWGNVFRYRKLVILGAEMEVECI